MKIKRILIPVVVLVVIVIIVAANLKSGSSPQYKVEGEVIKKGKIEEIVRADGQLKAVSQVNIGADVMGRIEKIYVKEGDMVKKGDTLCIIDRSTYLAKVKGLEYSLKQQEARLEKAKKDFERVKELYRKNLVSRAAYEEAEVTYKALRAQVEASRYSLEEARRQLEKTIILSPINGEVVGVNKEEGEMAVVGTINTPGSVIMTIADLSKMMVKAYIDESEVVKIKKGNKARIKIDAYPGKVFTGKVISVGGIPQQSTGQEYGISYPVEILINDTAYLLPGMSASCEIITGESSNALRVPIVALGKEKGSNKDYCFVVKSRVAKKRYVKTGIEGEVYIEVLEGVEEGDTVITGPFEIQRKLKDGDRVSVTLKEKNNREKTE